MTELIPVFDFELTEGHTISKKSPVVIEAIRRLHKEGKVREIDYEDVICPFELMLKCSEVANEIDKKRGNTNGKK